MIHMVPEVIVVIFASIGSLLLGLFTYYKNPKSNTNVLFLFFTITLAAYLSINYLSSSQNNSDSTFFWLKNVMSVAALLNLSFLMLSKAFPRSAPPFPPHTTVMLILFSLFIILLSQLGFIFSGVTQTPSNTVTTPAPGMALFLIQTFGFLGYSFKELIKKQRLALRQEKSQIKFFLIGTIFLFAAILFTNVLLVLVFQTSAFINLVPIYAFVFVSTISYAIMKHGFLDINAFVVRAVSFTVINLLFVAINATILFRFLPLIEPTYREAFTILIALFLVYTYNPLKNVVEKLTENVFHREPYSPEDLLEELGNITRSTLSLEHLSQKTLLEITNTMHISRAVYVIQDKNQNLAVIEQGFAHSPQYSTNTIHNLSNKAKNTLLIFDDLEESPVKMLMRQERISIVVPLKVKNESLGLLLLGEKSSGEIYSQQDIDVLEIFMPQIAIAIQNAQSYEEIKRFNITLKEEVDRATSELKKANRHLKHLDKLKNDFIFIATHELKNPVTAMRGYTSMLLEGLFGDIPPKIKEPLHQLQGSTQQLVDLVNDLLQIARSEAKTLTIFPEKINVCQTIDIIKENVKVLADQKGLTLTHACDSQPTLIKADPQRVKEILNNLLSNAIKYSEKGTIIISHEVNGKDIIIHVTDEGVGISPENQKKLFTKFFRVEEEAAKGIPGTGLGLFIIKEFIEKMGGKIWLESQKGVGSTFSFSLPKA